MPSLKDLRSAARLSQTELANASGVSLETIKKIESGRVARPHPATLRQLAAVLGQAPATLHSSRDGRVFDPGTPLNGHVGGSAVLEVVPDAERSLPLPAGFVPLRETRLTGRIEGALAALVLTQVFAYRRDECDRVLEARYRFPLPGDAAVTGVTARFGDVLIETTIAPRSEAQVAYERARLEGRQAALTTRESPDVFTLQLAGLQPDQEVCIQTTCVVAAMAHGPGWELRLPLTIGPRYSRPDELGTPAAGGQPLGVWGDPGHRFAVDLLIEAAETVASASHPLAVDAAPDGAYRVRLAEGAVLPDRDFVLAWCPPQPVERPALHVLVHEDLDEGMRYFLALVTPPAAAGRQPPVRRETTLLVDRSGSMAGPKWQAACRAVHHFLDGLEPEDTFNLGLFQSTCEWLAPAPLHATASHLDRARAFLASQVADGGTELGPALEQALRAERSPGPRARHVLVLTDAQVSDEARLLQLVEAEAERPDARRVSLVNIDAAPRSAFVRDLAEAGGGVAVFVSSSPGDEELAGTLEQVLDAWAQPVAADVQLVVETEAAAMAARGAAARTRSLSRLGDLPAGRSLWVSGAISLYTLPILRLRAGDAELAELALDVDSPPPDRPELRVLFGAHQINRLERLLGRRVDDAERDAVLDALGYAGDPARVPEPPPLYAENAGRFGTPVVEKLLVRESLRFGLVCSATAFVGVRHEAGRRVEATLVVPSALPAGWSDAFLTSPAAGPAMVRRALAAPLPSPIAPAPGAARRRPRPRVPSLREAADELLRLGRRTPTEPGQHATRGRLRYRGRPALDRGVALLVEGAAGRDLGPRLSRLRVALERGEREAIDPTVQLWVGFGDAATPRVRIRLRELLELGGDRPLDLEVPHGARVWVRLVGPAGGWPAAAGRLAVDLESA